MTELKKDLSLYGLIMVAIGASIGSGIFTTPSTIAKTLMSPSLILGVWAIGGLITITGALTYGELGGLFPRAGGIYAYLREAYGDLVAFLYGWTVLMVTNTGSIAFLVLTFAKYVNFFVPLGYYGIQIVAISAILLVTVINIFGVKIGEIFSNLFTGGKLLGIGVLILAGLWALTKGDAPIYQTPLETATAIPNFWSAVGVALIGVFFSYGGWQHASFLAGETRNAQRVVPIAMIGGALAVIGVYLLTNVAYLAILTPDQIASTDTIAADAMRKITPMGGLFIAFVIAISTLGTTSIYMMGVPRIYYAMAEDKIFFKKLAELHPIYRTPVYAIILQSAWAIVLLLLWGTLENLLNYVVFVDWIFFFLASITIFIFRYRKPDLVRPYRTWGYPLTPFIFATTILCLIVNTLIEKPIQANAGILLLASGVPLYFWFKRK
jgi:basic amino acid/polyamine antiporter, APA family